MRKSEALKTRSSGNGNAAPTASTGNGGAGNKNAIKKGSMGGLIAPVVISLGHHQIVG